MNNYKLGGWTQDLNALPKIEFSYIIFGMVTNLKALTTGTPEQPGWSPKTTKAPKTFGKSLWVYGGALCTPESMPSNEEEVTEISLATKSQIWNGVDFDNECNMDIPGIIKTMLYLEPLESSYTFIGGWDFNNPEQSTSGQAINDAIKKIKLETKCNRYIPMFYGDVMWTIEELKENVPKAIIRMLNMDIDKKRIVVTVTPAGLTDEILNYMLDQVLEFDVNGLSVWDFTSLAESHLNLIKSRLEI